MTVILSKWSKIHLSGKVGQMSATRNGIFEEENTFLTRCVFAAELKYYRLCDQMRYPIQRLPDSRGFRFHFKAVVTDTGPKRGHGGTHDIVQSYSSLSD